MGNVQSYFLIATVACAYFDGCLQEFLCIVTEALSFYAMSKSGTSAQAGKKPHKHKDVQNQLQKLCQVYTRWNINFSAVC